MTSFNQNESITDKIAGQPITAPQLGMSATQWQNGYGVPSDGKDTNSHNQPTRSLTKDAKSIIIYFSRSGSTELLAAKIANITKADVLEIVVKNPYPGKYTETLARANRERETHTYPELDMDLPDLSQYKRVYLGFPIWALTLSHPMTSFLLQYGSQLAGKQLVPFMTEGGYGQGNSLNFITQLLQSEGIHADLYQRPLVVDGNKVNREDYRIENWLKTLYKSLP